MSTLGDHPEYIYWALVFLIAFPLALINRVAAVVAVVRVVLQVAYDTGLPEPGTQVIVFLVALAASVLASNSSPLLLLVGLFYVPLTAAAISQVYDAWAGYWLIYWLLVAQVLLLPFAVDWAPQRFRIRAWFLRRRIDRGLRMITC